MKNNIRRFYDWPTLTKDIKEYIKNCSVCEKTKIQRHTKSPLMISSVATVPFQKIYIDHVGPICPASADGHSYIFTCSCDLTKYVIAIPVKDCTALTTARALVDNVFLKYNFAEIVVSDNGSAYDSELFKEITKLLRVKRVLTTPYHPQSNAVERYHKTLGHYMRAFANSEPENWHKFLRYATFSYNNTVHSTTNFSPHSLLFGFDVKLPTSITQSQPSYNYDSYKRELQVKLRETQKLARENILNRKETNKEFYDRKAPINFE
jgi:hypothetical protein